MSVYLHIKARYIPKVIKRGMGALLRARQDPALPKLFKIQWPKTTAAVRALRKMQKKLYAATGLKMDCVLDGMHLPVSIRAKRSTMSEQQKRYVDEVRKLLNNGKHSVYALNLLVTCDLFGRLLHVDGPYAGNEASQLRDCELRTLLRKGKLSIGADAGLHVNLKNDADPVRTFFSVGPAMIRLCKLVMRNEKRVPAEVYTFFYQILHSSRLVSRLRIVIENIIGYIRRYRILRDHFRGWAGPWNGERGSYSVPLDDAVAVVLMLVQSHVNLTSAMRAKDWVPDVSDIPKGFKFGYPGNPVNAKLLEGPAAKKIYVHNSRGKASLKKARDLLKAALEATGPNTEVCLPLEANPCTRKAVQKAAGKRTKQAASGTSKRRRSPNAGATHDSTDTDDDSRNTDTSDEKSIQYTGESDDDNDFLGDPEVPKPRGGSRQRKKARKAARR